MTKPLGGEGCPVCARAVCVGVGVGGGGLGMSPTRPHGCCVVVDRVGVASAVELFGGVAAGRDHREAKPVYLLLRVVWGDDLRYWISSV